MVAGELQSAYNNVVTGLIYTMWFEYAVKFVWEYWEGDNEGFQNDGENGEKAEMLAEAVRSEVDTIEEAMHSLLYAYESLSYVPMADLIYDNLADMCSERQDLIKKYDFDKVY
jgi:hypothetical protein